jgi:hypothetical protein
VLLLAVVWAGAALAVDAPLGEVPGETSVRLPLGSENYVLHGLLSPYLYGEYRFLRGRIDGSLGGGLQHREPDSVDFRAGFSIRLD